MREKLSKRTVDAAAPAERDLFLWDTDTHGFGLKVTPAGAKIYVLQYRFRGRLRRYTIGRHGQPWAPETARREAVRLLGMIAEGADPAAKRVNERAAPTLAEFAERYLAEHARPHKKPRSAEEDARNLRLHVLPALGSRLLAEIARADMVRFHLGLRSRPIAANRCLALLSTMFGLAERWGLRAEGSNPCRHVDKFKEAKRERWLDGEELARLGAALAAAEADGAEMPSAIAAIRLLMLTGCRVSEILTLKWDAVDLEGGVLRLADSKTGPRVVPLGAPALEVLARLSGLAGNPYVIIGERAGGHLIGIQRPWQRIRTRAGLDDVRLHDLRHSFASAAASANFGLPVIGALLGHRQPSTTQRYAHLAPHPLRATADRISSAIANAMDGGARAGAEVVPLRAPPGARRSS